MDEIRERIASKRKAAEQAVEAASIADWEAFEVACEEHGYDAVKRLNLPRFIEGLPTFLIVKAAPADNLRIFRQRVLKARKDKGGTPDLAAVDRAMGELGRACIVYPEASGVEAIKAEFPSVEKDAGAVAKSMSEAEEVEEGKE